LKFVFTYIRIRKKRKMSMINSIWDIEEVENWGAEWE
jgi:hypothetical protein